MHVGIAGEVRCVVTKADGKVKIDTGFQKNLILNQGLDFFGGGKGAYINASCAIGSGNSSPAITQTKLDSFLAIASGSDTTSNYSYVDEGDGLYKMWEQRKYRFTNLDNVNISEVGLVSQGGTTDYYLTTRALIKDSSGAAGSISLKLGETLDIYYKIYKVIDTTDKSFVVNILDGAGGSVPYNMIVRPVLVGNNNTNSVSPSALSFPSNLKFTTSDLVAIATFPSTGQVDAATAVTYSTYVAGSYKLVITSSIGLNAANTTFRTLTTFIGAATGGNYAFFNVQIRFGRVSDDAPLTKTNKDTLSIPLEFSWGRFEGEL